jgi:glycine cleavage system regulatory protein
MATLGGQFAGIVLTSVPDDRLEPLQAALDGLCAQGLTVSTSKGLAVQPLADQRTVRLEMTGQDRPGILREISHALVARGVSIEEFETECLSASWSGEVIFRATAELRVPADLPTERLREVLEGLGNELMVDITLDETISA